MRLKITLLLLSIGIYSVSVLTGALYGQSPSAYARDYEMVTVRGFTLPQFAGVPIHELSVMSYIEDAWVAIPFQIDEKNATDSYFLPDETAGLDDNDEIVFMAFDRGEKAPGPGIWPDDDLSKTSPRGVVNILDTILESTIGYVYIYRSGTLAKNSKDYITYTPPATSATAGNANDLIIGLTYTLGNDPSNGFPDQITVLQSAGGSGLDLADRFNIEVKLTATITIIFPININITLTEDDFKNARVANFIDGQVRILKQLLVDLDVSSVASINDIDIPIQHTPYAMRLAGIFDLNTLPSEVKSIDRFSLVFDFNQNAIPMTLFTPANPAGVSVNGQGGDIFDPTPVLLPNQHPFHTTGDQGTVVNVFSIPELGNIRNAFFEDNAGRTGAHGFVLDEQIATAKEESQSAFNNIILPLGFTGFFLQPNLPDTLGEDLAKTVKTPIAADANSEDFEEGVVPVELVSFAARVSGSEVELTWVTASETSNFGFDVERSKADLDDWQRAGFVPGHGTTTITQTYHFMDVDVPPGSYEYRLKQTDTDGSFEYSPVLTVIVQLPETLTLHQNFPNPFNPVTEIQYELPVFAGQSIDGKQVTLKVYDLLGRQVKTLVDEMQHPGFYTVPWHGTDDLGIQVPSGVYIYQIRFDNFSDIRKMVLVK